MIRNANEFRAGAAQVDITPPVGTSMTGYVLRDGPSEGTHDPLHSRALVFDDGTRQVAIIVCEVLALDSRFVASARSAISKATGIPDRNIMIASTHTHCGPATIFLRNCGEVDDLWLSTLQRRLVEVSQEALLNLRAARVGTGRGSVAVGAQNRRDAAGPADAELAVMRVDDAQGQTLAVVLNYACHPTFLGPDNRLFSADYPGHALSWVQRRTGAIALFITGAEGDVGPTPKADSVYNPLDAAGDSKSDPGSRTASARDFERAEAFGNRLAAEALRVLETISASGQTTVRVVSEILDLPLRNTPAVQDLEESIVSSRDLMREAEAASQPTLARVHGAMLGWAEATLAAVRDGTVIKSVPAEVQIICVDDAAFVGVPGEPFVELGLKIKEAAGVESLFICAYTNDDIGYIPTRDEYSRGGYEITEAFKYYGYPAALAPEAGEMLITAAIRLIGESAV